MALSFPSDPINGAVSGEYTYDATKGAWRKNAALPVSVTHSDVAPSNPREGDQWWKSNEGTLFTYYNDGTSSQWVESTNVVASSDPNPVPAGAMMAWASNTIPANWLLCDGSAVSRSTYASLFASVGTTYGSGDGTTTFNLPNIKGRTIVGRDSAQTEFDVLGETGGAKTHTLTEAEMPSHTHIQNAHTHIQDSHGHAFYGAQTGQNLSFTNTGNVWTHFLGNYQYSQPAVGGATATNQNTTATNQNTGGGGAHNNLQPYIVLNYIIKFSAGETPGDSQLAVRVGTLETQNNATPLSPNYIINGGFDIWQRGTSFSSAGYSADRWQYVPGATGTLTQQSTGMDGFQYCARYQRTSGNTTLGYQQLFYTMETKDSLPLAGRTVTLSFYARAGANFSAAANGLSLQLRTGTSTDQSATAMGTNTIAQTATLTTSWQRFSYTATIPPTATGIGINFYYFTVGTAGAADYFEVAGVQLEGGLYATPFRRNSPSIQAELAVCQRYYYRYTEAVNYAFLSSAMCWGGNEAVIAYKLPVTMRVRPSASISNLAGVYWLGNGTNYTGATNFNSYTTPETWGMYCTITIPANTPLMFRLPLNAYIEANAEI